MRRERGRNETDQTLKSMCLKVSDFPTNHLPLYGIPRGLSRN